MRASTVALLAIATVAATPVIAGPVHFIDGFHPRIGVVEHPSVAREDVLDRRDPYRPRPTGPIGGGRFRGKRGEDMLESRGRGSAGGDVRGKRDDDVLERRGRGSAGGNVRGKRGDDLLERRDPYQRPGPAGPVRGWPVKPREELLEREDLLESREPLYGFRIGTVVRPSRVRRDLLEREELFERQAELEQRESLEELN
ncbi:hypothetical protein BKA93DRAFT_89495 [Sparassis latifolia]